MSDVFERAMFILHTNKLADEFFADDDEESEDHLPAHKRSNYAEDMAEAADMRRKELREEAYEDVERTAYLGEID